MNEVKVPLVINKLESKKIFTYLSDNNLINLNLLYLILNDDTASVTNILYDSENKKFYYTNDNDENIDIITMSALKSLLDLSSVATSGSYNSLSNLPSINNVTLTGNKTTSDLNISYNELTNLPSIPEVTSTYSASDTTKATSGKAVASALGSYVPKTTSVTGTGALSGGGNLSSNVLITHNNAPTGLTPSAIKVGVDSYGHVQAGTSIVASDVDALSTNYKVITSCQNIEAAGYNTVLILGTTNETVSFTSVPSFGNKLRLYYANITDSDIEVTIDPENFKTSTYFFFNGKVLTAPYVYTVAANTNLCMDIVLIYYVDDEGTVMVFTFADVILNTGL